MFADDAALGDGESVLIVNQAQLVDGDVHLPVNVEENVENTAFSHIIYIYKFFFGEIVTILGTAVLISFVVYGMYNIAFVGL